jgi:hypothetical protein
MFVRHLIAAADAALLGGVGLAAPAAAHVSVAAGVIGIGNGRLVPTVAAVVGLIGVVIGGLALARSAGRIGTGNGRRGAIAAGVAGLIGMVVGGLHLATSTGGFGTGNGRAGAIVALVVGLIGIVLGGLALARSRRTGSPADPAMARQGRRRSR